MIFHRISTPMPDLPDWSALSPLLLRLYAELDPVRHARVMLEVLNQLVPADNVVLNRFHVTTGTYEVVTLPEGLAKPEEVDLVGKFLNQSPFPPYFVGTGDTQWKMTTDFMPVEDFHATELWQLGLRRWGINQQCCGMLAFMNATAHAVTINRTSAGFTEKERRLLNAIHPHLVTSYVNAQAFGQKLRTEAELRVALEQAPGAYGYFHATGALAWLQPTTRKWLLEIFSDETWDGSGLPSTLRLLRRQAMEERHSTQHVTRTKDGARFTCCLLPSPLGGWILRIERSPLASRLRLKPIPDLSSRENEVLQWLVEGKRNGEIATLLGISQRTVEKHVEHILVVLEAENRATAIVRAMEHHLSA